MHLLRLSGPLICAPVAGCTQSYVDQGRNSSSAGARAELAIPAAPPEAISETIRIREHSNICISVRVDRRLWTGPPHPSTDADYSGYLLTQLRLLHEEQGGSSTLPGPGRRSRFNNNSGGTNPSCRDVGEDIFVDVSYTPRTDGSPLIFTYRIQQGSVKKSGSVSRDIPDEWRRGVLLRFAKLEPISMAISDDIRIRASFIKGLIS